MYPQYSKIIFVSNLQLGISFNVKESEFFLVWMQSKSKHELDFDFFHQYRSCPRDAATYDVKPFSARTGQPSNSTQVTVFIEHKQDAGNTLAEELGNPKWRTEHSFNPFEFFDETRLGADFSLSIRINGNEKTTWLVDSSSKPA